MIPGDLTAGHGIREAKTDACHLSKSQAKTWGPDCLTPVVQAVAERPEFAPILGATTPYALRRGGISLRLRTEDPQIVASECGTSLKMSSGARHAPSSLSPLSHPGFDGDFDASVRLAKGEVSADAQSDHIDEWVTDEGEAARPNTPRTSRSQRHLTKKRHAHQLRGESRLGAGLNLLIPTEVEPYRAIRDTDQPRDDAAAALENGVEGEPPALTVRVDHETLALL